MPTKYVAGTSSGATADRLISENTTQPRPPRRYLSAEVRGPQTALLTGSVEIPLTGPEAWAPDQELPPREPGVIFVETGMIFCSAYRVFERAPQSRRTLPPTMELFTKCTTLEVHEKLLAPPTSSYGGCLFRTGFSEYQKAAPWPRRPSN